MVRVLSTLTLSVLLLTGAQAQSVSPAATKKVTVQASRAAKKAQRATAKAQRAAQKKASAAVKAATKNNGWPPLEDNAPVVASAATDANYGAPASSSTIGRDNVYAAPGMPVNIRVSKQAVPYSVRPPRKSTQSGTTLGSGN